MPFLRYILKNTTRMMEALESNLRDSIAKYQQVSSGIGNDHNQTFSVDGDCGYAQLNNNSVGALNYQKQHPQYGLSSSDFLYRSTQKGSNGLADGLMNGVDNFCEHMQQTRNNTYSLYETSTSATSEIASEHTGTFQENDINIKTNQREDENAIRRLLPTQESPRQVKAEEEPQPENTAAFSATETASTKANDSTSKRFLSSGLSKTRGNRRSRLKTFSKKFTVPKQNSPKEDARQCIIAAYSSRLNPYTLHSVELEMLANRITQPQVTIYLNIRNAILRLWVRNPLLSVTLEEAIGCAKSKQYSNLARVAYYWLLRNGYVNYGCVQTATELSAISKPDSDALKQRTVVVIGAGMSGLGCARQLQGLFKQFTTEFEEKGEKPPKVIILEGRGRIGGRVYSHPIRKQPKDPNASSFRATAELGAQIVTGFENGNPLNAIIRGQLALPYHTIRDNSILYDCDGQCVDAGRDALLEKLYNDILDKVSAFRNRARSQPTAVGDKRLIDAWKDPVDKNDSLVSSKAIVNGESSPLHEQLAIKDFSKTTLPKTEIYGIDGKEYGSTELVDAEEIDKSSLPATEWHLPPDEESTIILKLKALAMSADKVSLGTTMDEAINEYQRIIGLSTQDLRLLNWHHANLEYANAANVNQLSLGGWDQDVGNEFEGEHTQIVGGYSQVLRGLWKYPTQLDVHFKQKVTKIFFNDKRDVDQKATNIQCDNGSSFAADRVVITTPLGVLKENGICFEPPLPKWKADCIERMGFGLLNKVNFVIVMLIKLKDIGCSSIRLGILGG